MYIFSCAFCLTPVTFVSSGTSEVHTIPGFTVSPQEALEKAGPYLQKTFELRSKNRRSRITSPTKDFITAKGDWYYICRDNYPYKSIYAYQTHAVKINGHTGECIPPEED